MNEIDVFFKSQEEIIAYNLAEKERIGAELVARANLPRAYRTCALETWRKHEGWSLLFDRLVNMLNVPLQPGQCGAIVVLCGPRGTGKTVLAVETLRSFAKWGHWLVHFSSALHLLDRSRNKNADFQESFEDPKLIALDECAKIGSSPWEEVQFFNLVNSRSLDQKHSILTCAATPADLHLVLPPSIIDRLNQPPSGVLHLDWDSFRK